MVQEIQIALGSNLGFDGGSPAQTLTNAMVALKEKGFVIRRISRFFRTPCFPAGAGPDYVNACAVVRKSGTAHEILSLCHEVEAQFGRERVQRWGSRSLDIDVIAMDQMVVPDAQVQSDWCALPLDQQIQATPDQLILPHPRLQDRSFVLVPLCDVAADWCHPLLHKDVATMTRERPPEERASIVPM